MSINVGVLMGGFSEERVVSLSTGSEIIKACKLLGYKVTNMTFNKNYKRYKEVMKSCDIIFNALHGGIGENGHIQKWMDKNNIKYTGSGSKSSSICMNKSKTKSIATKIGINTPPWKIVKNHLSNINFDLLYVNLETLLSELLTLSHQPLLKKPWNQQRFGYQMPQPLHLTGVVPVDRFL